MKPLILILFVQVSFTKFSFSQLIFQKTYGDSLSEQAYAGDVTSDGGFFVAGIAFTVSGEINFYLVKTDSNGNMQWANTYGTTGVENFRSAIQTIDGGYLLAGSSYTTDYDIYLVKTDALGNLHWSRRYGGSDYDEAMDVHQTSDKGFIIAGVTKSFGAGDEDCILIKTDSSGTVLWTKTYGGSDVDASLSVRQTVDGGFALGGQTLSLGSWQDDFYLIKTDPVGNIEWNKAYDRGSNREYLSEIIQTTDHGFILSGASTSIGTNNYLESYLVKTDSIGNLEWSKTYGTTGDDNLNSVFQTFDGGYILSERTYLIPSGGWEGTVIKTNASGDTLWTRTYGGVGYNQCWDAIQTLDTGYLVTGFTTSFGAGSADCYLIKADSIGHSGCNEIPFELTINSTSTFVTIPSPVISAPQLIVDTPVTIVEARGAEAVQCFTDDIFEMSAGQFSLFPNPVYHDEVNITVKNASGLGQLYIEILDVLGQQKMEAYKLNGLQQKIQLNGLERGVYFVRLFNQRSMFTQKMIVQ